MTVLVKPKSQPVSCFIQNTFIIIWFVIVSRENSGSDKPHPVVELERSHCQTVRGNEL